MFQALLRYTAAGGLQPDVRRRSNRAARESTEGSATVDGCDVRHKQDKGPYQRSSDFAPPGIRALQAFIPYQWPGLAVALTCADYIDRPKMNASVGPQAVFLSIQSSFCEARQAEDTPVHLPVPMFNVLSNLGLPPILDRVKSGWAARQMHGRHRKMR